MYENRESIVAFYKRSHVAREKEGIMNIKIMTDSTADIPQKVAEQYGITVVSLDVIMDGQPRKAVDVTELCPPKRPVGPQGGTVEYDGYTEALQASCEYFTTEKYVVDGTVEIDVNEASFASLVITEGAGEAACSENTVAFKAADSLFVPAGTGKVTLSGKCTVVKTTV